ncbi:MAG TPA: hypothetical protein VLS25_08875, partial [Dehalococcoidia bacterium]|nr:hypothetical protein [Dehalococcoidia bacterium]
ANGQDSTNQHDKDKDGIGDVCDKNPDTRDGELILQQPTKDITIGSGGTGGTPLDAPACSRDGKVVCYDLSGPVPTSTTETPTKEDGGSNALIFIVIGVVAAVVIVGGGAFALTRRRSS